MASSPGILLTDNFLALGSLSCVAQKHVCVIIVIPVIPNEGFRI